ncbi:MAG TPA: hypothetical protein EYH30_05700 [Anaerolineales bacterium]|nr:hypothetical protein [Anaerolineae bacterium]HIQ01608.1 hypothetical protein [Anaerolineales bacterium]
MEEIVSTVLSASVVVALLVLVRRWGGPSAAPQPTVVGTLIVPISPMAAACLARRRDPLSCLGCRLRQQCWGLRRVPAAEEIAGRPGGVAGEGRRHLDPGLDLEQVGRFLDAAGRLLGRLVELLTLLTTEQVTQGVGRLIRLLLALVSGKVRLH